MFNRSFDPDVIPYAGDYENRQGCSPTFREHMAGLVADLTARHALHGKRILEVGCGQGDFLTLLCETSGARGVGYDKSYQEHNETRGQGAIRGAVRLRRRHRQVRRRGLPSRGRGHREIGEFLAGLRSIAERCGGAVTLIETPDFEWTARNACFWDVFYEHCNYFTRPTLAYLCRRAGLSVASHRRVFGGQYQVLELNVRQGPGTLQQPRRPVALTRFAQDAEAAVASLEQRLVENGANDGWAIWGAGAKGVTLAGRLRLAAPRLVVDANPAKQGCIIPATRVPIVAPDDPKVLDLELVLTANPNYATEIEATVREFGYATILAA